MYVFLAIVSWYISMHISHLQWTDEAYKSMLGTNSTVIFISQMLAGRSIQFEYIEACYEYMYFSFNIFILILMVWKWYFPSQINVKMPMEHFSIKIAKERSSSLSQIWPKEINPSLFETSKHYCGDEHFQAYGKNSATTLTINQLNRFISFILI